ncbi:MAG: 50S ribosomal protein L15 [SAR202 cluster bacterium Casp-Chloro-G4]|nr:50S ribosomal protein L15 [Chloroflexota bacterium]MDA1228281.1 50S ribosomal protein L15 [Chloroflexota bacterium]PKB61383.1 MAG: 50S ribosomal protein L15 [SAR202 cluster bacterium Casp-Chloro-G4]
MQQHEINPPPGGKHKQKRRVGRGDSSGFGSYSGKGMKGQKSRSGGGVRPGFEGGQLALMKKLPMIRGFTNRFRVAYTAVNLDRLAGFEPNTEVTPELLGQAGIVRALKSPIKILGRGEIDVPLSVAAHKFSASARQKIEAAGGSVREIG